MKIDRKFYERNTEKVARELLGNILIHKNDDNLVGGKIVETEAYYGKDDPASRASEKKTKINKIMWRKGGLALVYMVHGNWLFNVTTEGDEIPGAVLIRAIEPVYGREIMKERRYRKETIHLTSGPGKMTEALDITKNQHGADLTMSYKLYIQNLGKERNFKIGTSHRIGVTEDLDKELRFFIEENKFVSC